MQKNKRFMVDPGKAIAGSAMAAFLLLMAAVMVRGGRWFSAAVFLTGAGIYARQAVINGMLIGWDENGVSEWFLGKRVKTLAWEEIKEAGICGTRVFNQKHPEKTGRMYLYFSKEKMDGEGRFDMILQWPPKDKRYLLYEPDRVESLRLVWDGRLETYNVGGLEV